MYNDYNNEQNRSDYEYHYSYRSDADGFQPTTPVPAAPRKKKRAMKSCLLYTSDAADD